MHIKSHSSQTEPRVVLEVRMLLLSILKVLTCSIIQASTWSGSRPLCHKSQLEIKNKKLLTTSRTLNLGQDTLQIYLKR